MHRFVTSDIHLFHDKIFDFCPDSRPYQSLEHMHESIIYAWNKMVPHKNSVVYILGDVSFGKFDETIAIIKRLNGQKILVMGNHDKHLFVEKRNKPEERMKQLELQSLFYSIHDYLEIHAAGVRVCLFHFPIAEHHGIQRGSIHLYGHCHGNANILPLGRTKDVGMDTNNCMVYNLDELAKQMLELPVRSHHGVIKDATVHV